MSDLVGNPEDQFSHNEAQIAHEPLRDKTKEITCALSEDSDQLDRPPNMIRVSIVSIQEAKVHRTYSPISAQQDWSSCLMSCVFARSTDEFVGFVTLRLARVLNSQKSYSK